MRKQSLTLTCCYGAANATCVQCELYTCVLGIWNTHGYAYGCNWMVVYEHSMMRVLWQQKSSVSSPVPFTHLLLTEPIST